MALLYVNVRVLGESIKTNIIIDFWLFLCASPHAYGIGSIVVAHVYTLLCSNVSFMDGIVWCVCVRSIHVLVSHCACDDKLFISIYSYISHFVAAFARLCTVQVRKVIKALLKTIYTSLIVRLEKHFFYHMCDS